MRKTLKKGRGDFRRKVKLWGIEGGSIVPCPNHPEVLLESEDGPQGGHKVIQYAWAIGHISSDAQAAKDLLDEIMRDLPKTCPKCG